MSEVFGGKMVFPIHNTGHGAPFDEGMSLRDYIAIQAMQAFIITGVIPADGLNKKQAVVSMAYETADEMMAYRDSGE